MAGGHGQQDGSPGSSHGHSPSDCDGHENPLSAGVPGGRARRVVLGITRRRLLDTTELERLRRAAHGMGWLRAKKCGVTDEVEEDLHKRGKLAPELIYTGHEQ
uniref:Uncharacterized protein n=1 Tax=Aegilops tauschii TaxID=37682 RepID=R7W316_AEGTA